MLNSTYGIRGFLSKKVFLKQDKYKGLFKFISSPFNYILNFLVYYFTSCFKYRQID